MKVLKTSLMWIGGIFVVLLVIGLILGKDDQDAAHGDAASASTKPAAKAKVQAKPASVYRTTARALERAYDRNEVATDAEINGRPVVIDGMLEAIDKDFTDAIVLRLKVGNPLMSADMTLKDSQRAAATKLSKGQRVRLRCDSMSRVLGEPTGEDCVLLRP